MSESWRFWRDALAGRSSRSDTWAISLRLLHSTNLPEPAVRDSTRGSGGATIRRAPPQFMGCAFVADAWELVRCRRRLSVDLLAGRHRAQRPVVLRDREAHVTPRRNRRAASRSTRPRYVQRTTEWRRKRGQASTRNQLIRCGVERKPDDASDERAVQANVLQVSADFHFELARDLLFVPALDDIGDPAANRGPSAWQSLADRGQTPGVQFLLNDLIVGERTPEPRKGVGGPRADSRALTRQIGDDVAFKSVHRLAVRSLSAREARVSRATVAICSFSAGDVLRFWRSSSIARSISCQIWCSGSQAASSKR